MAQFRSDPAAPGHAARSVAGVVRAVDWRSMDCEGECFGWDALTLHAAEPNPFLESWFLLPALRALDPQGSVQLLRFEIGGRLAGLLPMRAERSYYGRPLPQLCAWVHPNCFLGAPLVAAGDEEEFWRALFAWADAQGGRALFLHLRAIPLSGPLHSALQEVLAEQQRLGAVVRREERALLASSLSAEAYFEASMSGKKRKELRRQHARLAELGTLTLTRQRDDEALDPWIAEYLALEARGWKGAAGTALADRITTTRLFTEALRGAAQCGRLERLTLRLDGKAIAMLAQFITPPGAYSFKTTYDEDYARYSPGVLLQRENLALLDHGLVAWADSCAAADHPMIERIWRERRPIGSLSIAIGGRLRRGLFHLIAAAETRRLQAREPA